jgi:hypothetical protein
MADNLSEGETMLTRLVSFSRNRYFYGKFLTERDLTLEQGYVNRKRWLVNRLGLGSGVLCGLEVELSKDGSCLLVQPGVAIDPLGREIIVPEAYCLANPRQPTDCEGKPTGKAVDGAGTLYLCLCYRECDSEPVPVMVSDCETRQACAANMVRERYCLRLCTEIGRTDTLPCSDIFPAPPPKDFDYRGAVSKAIRPRCDAPTTDCVVLADVKLPADAKATVTVDMFSHRTTLFSNAMLFDLLMCLAQQMAVCCQLKTLKKVSGDAQTGAPGQRLEKPVVVKVVDGNSAAVAKEPVTFTVTAGGGQVAEAQPVISDANGLAQATWKLGPTRGLNTLEASISSGSTVLFSALAQNVRAPVILSTTPANGKSARSVPEKGLALLFDEDMFHPTLAAPEKWLGVWIVRDTQDEARSSLAMRILPVYRDRANGGPARDVIYDLRGWPKELSVKYTRVLVLIDAQPGAIVSDKDQVTLDAEFKGTALDLASKTGLLPTDPEPSLQVALQGMHAGDNRRFTAALFNGLTGAAQIPGKTGDGAPGGLFHGYYTLS